MATFNVGDTFLLDTPGQKKWHLHIVLCGPDGDPPTIIVVPLNTWTPMADQTVVLQSGDHPFVTHASCVSYNLMTILHVAPLEELERVNRGRGPKERSFDRQDKATDALLQRICRGTLESDLVPKKVLQEFQRRLGTIGG